MRAKTKTTTTIIESEWADMEPLIKKWKYNRQFIRIGGGESNQRFSFNKDILNIIKNDDALVNELKYCDLFFSAKNNAVLIYPSQKLTSQGFRISKYSEGNVFISIKYLFEIYSDKLIYDKLIGLYEPRLVTINDKKFIGVFLDEKVS